MGNLEKRIYSSEAVWNIKPGQPISRILSGRQVRFTPRGASSLPDAEVIICLGRASQRASLQPTWDSRETSSLPSRRSSSLFGLAPGGGCPAASIAACAGGLLHHHFTLTPEGAVCFCGPIRQIAPPRTLSGTVLIGVRTFLTPRRGRNHLADLDFHDNTGRYIVEGQVM